MRLRAVPAVVLLSLMWIWGCSGEESPPRGGEDAEVRVVKPIPEPRRAGEKAPAVKERAAAPVQGIAGVSSPGKADISLGEEPLAGVAVGEPADAGEDRVPPGAYEVEEGETLASIAAREEVYGDPLKWPLLFQVNRERLRGVPMDAGLPHRPLPSGLRLCLSPPGDEDTGERAPGGDWVVNVISSPSLDPIEGPAVKLLENGYPVYISRATVEGKEWMRLRVGFFNSREQAADAGKELQDLLGLEDSWPVRMGASEKEEYAALLP